MDVAKSNDVARAAKIDLRHARPRILRFNSNPEKLRAITEPIEVSSGIDL